MEIYDKQTEEEKYSALTDEIEEETKEKIRKIQSDLIRIANGERFFFNIVQYKNLGLIYWTDKHGTDATGNDIVIGTDYHLTDKAKQYIKIAI